MQLAEPSRKFFDSEWRPCSAEDGKFCVVIHPDGSRETFIAEDSTPVQASDHEPNVHEQAQAATAQIYRDAYEEFEEQTRNKKNKLRFWVALVFQTQEEAYARATEILGGGKTPPEEARKHAEERRKLATPPPTTPGELERWIVTESQAAYGSAQLRVLQRGGFATKAWITVGDDRVRETHRACEAQGDIPIGDKFTNGLLYPGDPAGQASEVCNCRCWLVGVKRT